MEVKCVNYYNVKFTNILFTISGIFLFITLMIKHFAQNQKAFLTCLLIVFIIGFFAFFIRSYSACDILCKNESLIKQTIIHDIEIKYNDIQSFSFKNRLFTKVFTIKTEKEKFEFSKLTISSVCKIIDYCGNKILEG